MMSNDGLLPVHRVALVTPPNNWFHGISSAIAEEYRRALVDLGLTVFPVPLDAFLPPDLSRIGQLLEDLRTFQPELVLGAPSGHHVLLCRLPSDRHGHRKNIFTEVLDIPTICIWEHPPAELANQAVSPSAERPSDSIVGAKNIIRRALNHPQIVHWSRDTGQTAIMNKLGFVHLNNVLQLGFPLTLASLPRVDKAAAQESTVAFVGHFYQDSSEYGNPALNAVASNVVEQWMRDRQVPLWDVVTAAIEELPLELRCQLKLDQDETYFWSFAHQLIVRHAQTIIRLHMLRAANIPITCFGNLNPMLPGLPPNVSVQSGTLSFNVEVPAIMGRHSIVIDVVNPGSINGYTEKVLMGFAAGGFVLTDRKRDLIETFGAIGEAISYTDGNDLRAKIDRYLTNPRLRCEIANEMRAQVIARHTLPLLLTHFIQMAADRIKRSTAASSRSKNDSNSVILCELLQSVRTHEYWTGARVTSSKSGVVVETPKAAWSFAAEISIPPLIQAMNEPHLRLQLKIEKGRLGVALLSCATGELLSEQFASASDRDIQVTINLPKDINVSVILRNTTNSRCRAVISRLELADYLE